MSYDDSLYQSVRTEVDHNITAVVWEHLFLLSYGSHFKILNNKEMPMTVNYCNNKAKPNIGTKYIQQ